MTKPAPQRRAPEESGPLEIQATPVGGRRILVTGASGFVGRHLVRRLTKLGADVHAVSRRTDTGRRLGVGSSQVDLRDSVATARAIRSYAPDVVLHLASQVVGERRMDLALPTLQDNLLSSVNLLTAAAERDGCRVVLAGSIEEPRPGTDPVPSSPYAAAKWASTGYAQMFHRLWDVPAVSLRITMVYGPGQREAKLVPHLITSLANGVAPEVTSGNRNIDWVYVGDVVTAFLRAATRSGVGGHVIEIGSGIATTIRETAELVVELTGSQQRPLYGALQDRPHDGDFIADTSTADALLGWRPSTPLVDGMRRTIESYRSQHRNGTSVNDAAALADDPREYQPQLPPQ